MNDAVLAKAATQMRERIAVFDKLRKAMRIALPDGHAGLNDDGEPTDIYTIENRLKKFHQGETDRGTGELFKNFLSPPIRSLKLEAELVFFLWEVMTCHE